MHIIAGSSHLICIRIPNIYFKVVILEYIFVVLHCTLCIQRSDRLINFIHPVYTSYSATYIQENSTARSVPARKHLLVVTWSPVTKMHAEPYSNTQSRSVYQVINWWRMVDHMIRNYTGVVFYSNTCTDLTFTSVKNACPLFVLYMHSILGTY